MKYTHEEFAKILFNKNKNIELLGKYNGAESPLECKCLICNHEWVIPKAYRLIAKTSTGCPKCAGALKLTHNEFIKKLHELTDDILVVGKYVDGKTPIECKCKICGGTWYPSPSNLINRKQLGCAICTNHKVERGINDMWTTNPEMAKLLLNAEDGYKYTQRSTIKLNWKCDKCGKTIKGIKPDNVFVNGLSCKFCSDGISYPEKLMTNILIQTDIDFIKEKTFDWCKYSINGIRHKGFYDFYFIYNGSQYIVEMDGGIGHGNTSHTKSKISPEVSLKIDNEKDRLANLHDITVIRIDSKKSDLDYIRNNVITSELNDILRNYNIDFELANKQSFTSKVMDAINMYNDGYLTNEISKMLYTSRATAQRYVMKGFQAGLCNYTNPTKKKPVKCITTGEIFESIENAKKKYKTKNISNCCNGKGHYAGKLPDGTKLIWEYVD